MIKVLLRTEGIPGYDVFTEQYVPKAEHRLFFIPENYWAHTSNEFIKKYEFIFVGRADGMPYYRQADKIIAGEVR